MPGELDGTVALVTGGGRGIGRAIAQVLAAAGARVAVTSRTAAQLDETVTLIRDAGGQAVAFVADVEQQLATAAMLAEAERAVGPITVLVNNAGASAPGSAGPFETLEFDAIRKGIDNNLLAAMLCTRLALPGMLERGAGRIINVASGAGIIGMPFFTTYGVAKAGLIRFSENLALEVKGRGVSVFSITPGMVRTRPTEGLWQMRDMTEFPDSFPSWLATVSGPPNENLRLGSSWQPPERAGELCRFLASGAADRLTGCYFSAYHNEADIVAHAEEVERDMLYTLRMSTLQGVERPTPWG